ncbi:MAG: hypothetical protein ABIO39_14070 [Caulobacteraceae bacterium]
MRVRGIVAAVVAGLICAMAADAQAADRRLTAGRQAAVVKALAGFAPVRVDIFIFGDTPEIMALTTDISATLRQAGWRPKLWAQANTIAYGVVGVPAFAREAAGAKADAGAEALVAALKAQKIASAKFHPFHDNEPPDRVFEGAWDSADVGAVRVYVGLNPG